MTVQVTIVLLRLLEPMGGGMNDYLRKGFEGEGIRMSVRRSRRCLPCRRRPFRELPEADTSFTFPGEAIVDSEDANLHPRSP